MKPSLRLLLLSVIILIASLPRATSASTLHLVLVADTTDEKIGESVRHDLLNLATAFRNIADAAGMKLNLQQVSGYDLTARNVGKAVIDVDPAPDDAVVFFYNGHGFRTPSSRTVWPSISLMNNKGMELAAIFQTLDIKKPRFFLVAGDCCNNTIPDGLIDIVAVRTARPTDAQRAACRKLFAESRGAVIASSSKPGEYSVGLVGHGGVFTIAFLNALNAELQSSNPSWHSVMSKATRPIRLSGNRVQHPQFGTAGKIANSSSNPQPKPQPKPKKKPKAQPDPPPKPQPKPKPKPSSNQPIATALAVEIDGIQNVVYVDIADNGNAHRGAYEVSGIGIEKRFTVSGRDPIRLDISGIQNIVILPAALKNRVKYDVSGINNENQFARQQLTTSILRPRHGYGPFTDAPRRDMPGIPATCQVCTSG